MQQTITWNLVKETLPTFNDVEVGDFWDETEDMPIASFLVSDGKNTFIAQYNFATCQFCHCCFPIISCVGEIELEIRELCDIVAWAKIPKFTAIQ